MGGKEELSQGVGINVDRVEDAMRVAESTLLEAHKS